MGRRSAIKASPSLFCFLVKGKNFSFSVAETETFRIRGLGKRVGNLFDPALLPFGFKLPYIRASKRIGSTVPHTSVIYVYTTVTIL